MLKSLELSIKKQLFKYTIKKTIKNFNIKDSDFMNLVTFGGVDYFKQYYLIYGGLLSLASSCYMFAVFGGVFAKITIVFLSVFTLLSYVSLYLFIELNSKTNDPNNFYFYQKESLEESIKKLNVRIRPKHQSLDEIFYLFLDIYKVKTRELMVDRVKNKLKR